MFLDYVSNFLPFCTPCRYSTKKILVVGQAQSGKQGVVRELSKFVKFASFSVQRSPSYYDPLDYDAVIFVVDSSDARLYTPPSSPGQYLTTIINENTKLDEDEAPVLFVVGSKQDLPNVVGVGKMLELLGIPPDSSWGSYFTTFGCSSVAPFGFEVMADALKQKLFQDGFEYYSDSDSCDGDGVTNNPTDMNATYYNNTHNNDSNNDSNNNSTNSNNNGNNSTNSTNNTNSANSTNNSNNNNNNSKNNSNNSNNYSTNSTNSNYNSNYNSTNSNNNSNNSNNNSNSNNSNNSNNNSANSNYCSSNSGSEDSQVDVFNIEDYVEQYDIIIN